MRHATRAAVAVFGVGSFLGCSSTVTPADGGGSLPGAPTSLVASASKDAAILVWNSAPDNGSPLFGYVISSLPDAGTLEVGLATAATVVGLTPGTSYTFTIAAVNAAGRGPIATSAPVTPYDVPGAPGHVVATAGLGQATVTWTAATDNGSPVKSYQLTLTDAADGGQSVDTQSVDGSATSATLTGLVGGANYTVSVAATNAFGTGLPATAAVTPTALPGPPGALTVTPGQSQAVLSWSPSVANGSAITGYTVTATPNFSGGAQTQMVGAGMTQLKLLNLEDGFTYVFSVSATSAAGTGPAALATASPVAQVNIVGVVDGGYAPYDNFLALDAQGAVYFDYYAPAMISGNLRTVNYLFADPAGGAPSPIAVIGYGGCGMQGGATDFPSFGFEDGGAPPAALESPIGVAVLPSGSIAAADNGCGGGLAVRVLSADFSQISGALVCFCESLGACADPFYGCASAQMVQTKGYINGFGSSISGGVTTLYFVDSIDGVYTVQIDSGGTVSNATLLVPTVSPYNPGNLAQGPDGSLFAPDPSDQEILTIGIPGSDGGSGVNVLAGFGGAGYRDGPGLGDGGPGAQFNQPSAVAVDAKGFVYVADRANNRVRKIAPDGTTATLAGNGGTVPTQGPGGPYGAATFNSPATLGVDASRAVYVLDSQSLHKISQ